MSNIGYWLLAILMFGLVILIHELGHFWAARLTGVHVMEFAVGFGPPLWKRKAKSGVVYSVRALPLGGYCRFAADDEPDIDPKDAYYEQKVWKRVAISLAGPAANLLTALLILFFLFFILAGVPQAQRVIGAITPGMPAETAGLQVGDTIQAVNGEPARSVEEISAMITAAGENPVVLSVLRDGKEITLSMEPVWVEAEKRAMIGIQYAVTRTKYLLGPSLSGSWLTTVDMGTSIFRSLRDIIVGDIGMDQLAGPIGTVTIIKEQTEEGGLLSYLSMAAMISVNLALFNLLPIPGLDGSKLVFLTIEKIRGKRMNPNKEGAVLMAGFALMMVLMVVIMYKDIVRLFQ